MVEERRECAWCLLIWWTYTRCFINVFVLEVVVVCNYDENLSCLERLCIPLVLSRCLREHIWYIINQIEIDETTSV
jgi:hypothetical protein